MKSFVIDIMLQNQIRRHALTIARGDYLTQRHAAMKNTVSDNKGSSPMHSWLEPELAAKIVQNLETVGKGAPKARIEPSEDSFCRIRRPIAKLWFKKTVKIGPLRSICSQGFPSPTGSYTRK